MKWSLLCSVLGLLLPLAFDTVRAADGDLPPTNVDLDMTDAELEEEFWNIVAEHNDPNGDTNQNPTMGGENAPPDDVNFGTDVWDIENFPKDFFTSIVSWTSLMREMIFFDGPQKKHLVVVVTEKMR